MKPIPSLVVKDGQIVQAQSSFSKGLYVGAAGTAALLAVGLAGYWLGQSGHRSDDGPSQAAVQSALQAAVAQAQREVRPANDDEKNFLQAQQNYLKQEPETPEQVKARLDRLASAPQALQAHNANVLNRVSAQAPTQGPAADLARAVSASQQLPADKSKTGALQEEAAQREAAGRTYVVKAGDTLWAIAEQVYVDPHQFQKLFDANPRVLASPNHIFPGQVLRVPG